MSCGGSRGIFGYQRSGNDNIPLLLNRLQSRFMPVTVAGTDGICTSRHRSHGPGLWGRNGNTYSPRLFTDQILLRAEARKVQQHDMHSWAACRHITRRRDYSDTARLGDGRGIENIGWLLYEPRDLNLLRRCEVASLSPSPGPDNRCKRRFRCNGQALVQQSDLL